MKNNKLIKQLILEIIQKNEGHCDWRIIRSKVISYYHSRNLLPIPTDKQITHSAYLLERDDVVERLEELPVGIFYRITPWGHAILSSWCKKWAYFLMYKNHNFFAISAFILSIIAIILSDRVWVWIEALFN